MRYATLYSLVGVVLTREYFAGVKQWMTQHKSMLGIEVGGVVAVCVRGRGE
jgi:hypothetical protein